MKLYYPVLVILTLSSVYPIRGEHPATLAEVPGVSIAKEFPELAATWQQVSDFVFNNTIRIGKDGPVQTYDPFPPKARVVAFEENKHAIYAVAKFPAGTRRILFLKPSVIVLDDYMKPAGQWSLRGQAEPSTANNRLYYVNEDQALSCETLWPTSNNFQKAASTRFLHVLQFHRDDASSLPARASLTETNGTLRLQVTTSKQVVRLELPPPGAGAGWIAMGTGEGEKVSARRPLASGILPHGPQGMSMIERWDRAYRDGRIPTWDTGLVAGDLKKVVEEGTVRPCRTVVLGCGSGVNAVYLAQRGFDVTAIDVSPTALSLAEEKARKAGVKVNWMLADVLALPDLEPFDFMFDRGCYHNVRYVNAGAFLESARGLSKSGTQFLVLSLNRDGPPGVREHHMREDFSKHFDFAWLNDSQIRTHEGGENARPSWALMLRRR